MMGTKRKPLNRAVRRRVMPAAVEAFKAGDAAALKRALGMKPWEFPGPLDVTADEPCPWLPRTAGAAWWPELLALRRELEAASQCT